MAYDPFGNQVVTTGNPTNNTLTYTGREIDPDTGLYYYRVRPYDPTTGTFITEDPMGFAAGVNFYQYAGNNPINANDPYGMDHMFYGRCLYSVVGVGQAPGGALGFKPPNDSVAIKYCSIWVSL